jgi:protoporphyrinogen oxidase
MIGILGGGLAGLSAAYHLQLAGRSDFLVLEREQEAGGLCRSWTEKGYTFDYGPHIIYTRDQYAMGLFEKFLHNNLTRKRRENWIYLYRTLVKYPFETFLHGLPPKVIMECLEGVLDARKNATNDKPANFLDWIMATFGEGIAKHYFIPYNLKVWKYPLERMSIDWVFGRVPSPDVRDMMRGALGIQNQEFGPNAEFQYPRRGGIGMLPRGLASSIRGIDLGCSVKRIRKGAHGLRVVFERDGKEETREFGKLISTIPLPDLIPKLEDAPEEVRKAADNLVFTSLICMGIGVKRKGIHDKHSLYYPEKDFLFNRLSFPMNMASSTAPKGCSSILVEVTVRKGEMPNLAKTANRIMGDLVKAGILRRSDKVEYKELRTYSHGYVVYDLDHRKNVDTVHGYMRGLGIIPAGRFADWEYHNMDKSMLSGKRAAEELMGMTRP